LKSFTRREHSTSTENRSGFSVSHKESYLKSTGSRSPRRILFAVAVFVLAAVASADAAGRRDVLWEIVNSCLDPGIANYCSSCKYPLTGTSCSAGLACKETTEVWDQSAEFVVLRDRKMCECRGEFVHGLVIPKSRVTGVEDPRRPDGIWEFAWKNALKRIGDPSAAALVVNPVGTRAQDQLHVHIIRLRSDARQRFCKTNLAHVQDLADVWQVAARRAAAAGLRDYGVLVATDPQGGFLVLVDEASPEKSYAIERCR
jgi:CDP-diacylglycerol pyrophosphatase